MLFSATKSVLKQHKRSFLDNRNFKFILLPSWWILVILLPIYCIYLLAKSLTYDFNYSGDFVELLKIDIAVILYRMVLIMLFFAVIYLYRDYENLLFSLQRKILAKSTYSHTII